MWNQEMADKYIPGYMQGGLRRWIEHGIEPGSFLCAVLMNDLSGAVGRADATNIQILPNYVLFLYNHAPRGCWGSKEKCDQWAKNHASGEE